MFVKVCNFNMGPPKFKLYELAFADFIARQNVERPA